MIFPSVTVPSPIIGNNNSVVLVLSLALLLSTLCVSALNVTGVAIVVGTTSSKASGRRNTCTSLPGTLTSAEVDGNVVGAIIMLNLPISALNVIEVAIVVTLDAGTTTSEPDNVGDSIIGR